MKQNLIYGLSMVMLVGTLVLSSGCRSQNRTRTIFAGDHNVTVVKKPRRKRIKLRRKAVNSRRFNKVRR